MRGADKHDSNPLSRLRHQIRSPLSVISGYAYLLSLHEENPERKRWCQAIERSCKTLDGLIGELMCAARQKIEASERILRGEDSSAEYQKKEGDVNEDEERPKVLLVEDDEDLSHLTSSVLEINGFDCSVAATAREGREAIAGEPFDFIVLDLVLPDGRGTDLIPDLKQGPNQHTPLIVSSGNINPSERRLENVKGFFEKPYDIQDLVGFMRELQ